jgi:putative transposase
LKFARDRDAYRGLLRQQLKGLDVRLLEYCLTSNHVHLLLDTPEREQLSRLMQGLAGESARAYNRRKDRMNAYWGDNYHATAVEEGPYLWSCLVYIELNMVRCGVVKHPRDWEWVGYREIMGERRRYRLMDVERLCWRLRTDNMDEVRKNLEWSIAERIAKDQMKREPCWTEGLAVGSRQFVEEMEPRIVTRREMDIVESETGWVLKDDAVPYEPKTGLENERKASN